MRDDLNCPFLPGSGRVPDIWAGREIELADAEGAARRRQAGVYERGRAVLGEYGIGKSVLVNRIALDHRSRGDWVAEPVRIPAGADPLPLLTEALSSLIAANSLDAAIGQRAKVLWGRVSALTLPIVSGGVELVRGSDAKGRDAELSHRDVFHLLYQVGRLARDQNRLVLIRIDEVQNAAIDGLSRLLTVLGDVLEAMVTENDPVGTPRERALPLLVYLSGLPDFRQLAADAGATFARRFKTHELDYLTEPELRTALHPFTSRGWSVVSDEGPAEIRMAPDAIDLIVDRCVGDPYLFQLAGEAAWNAGSGTQITAEEARRGWRLIRRETVRYVEGRIGSISDLQLTVLRSAAAISKPNRTGDAVARHMDRGSSRDIASTLQSLDRTHRLIRREAGQVVFRSEAVRRFLAGDWP